MCAPDLFIPGHLSSIDIHSYASNELLGIIPIAVELLSDPVVRVKANQQRLLP